MDDAEKDYPIIYTSLSLPSKLKSNEVSIVINNNPPNGSYALGNITITPQRSIIRTLYQTSMVVGVGIQDYVLLDGSVNFNLIVTKDKYPTINAPANITLAVGIKYTLNLAEIINDIETPYSQLKVTWYVNGNTTMPSFISWNSTHRKF